MTFCSLLGVAATAADVRTSSLSFMSPSREDYADSRICCVVSVSEGLLGGCVRIGRLWSYVARNVSKDVSDPPYGPYAPRPASGLLRSNVASTNPDTLIRNVTTPMTQTT